MVVYTRSPERNSSGAFRRGGIGRCDFPAVDVIPHGVDRDRFFPFPELVQQVSFNCGPRQAERDNLFGDGPDPAQSFVVLNASRPDSGSGWI